MRYTVSTHNTQVESVHDSAEVQCLGERTTVSPTALNLTQGSASRSTNTVCLFVCGISLTSGQLFNELFLDCTRSCFSQVVSRRRGGDRIYEMRCLFVAVGLNARFIVLPHWDNMS